MTNRIKFIHVADLHLGAPIRGLRDVSPEWAARLQTAIAEAYMRVVDTAISRRVDFVVLAGDAFDTSRPSYGDYLLFFEGLERLDEAGIPVYLISGNHDPFTTWAADIERLPESAQLLGANGPEFALFKRAGEPACLIGGRSYYNQSWPDDDNVAAGISRAAAVEALAVSEPRADEAPFMVGVIHTGLHIDVSKAPSDLGELLATDVDYWACGHLHKRIAFPSESDPRVVFSGCVQGRDVKETGERGCYLVELQLNGEATEGSGARGHASATLEFMPTASVVFQQMKVDVGACQTLADVARLVQAQLFHENGKVFSDEMVVRVTLTGATALHGFLRRREIIEDLRKHINNAYPSFFCDALVDGTRPDDAEAAQVGRRGTPSSSLGKLTFAEGTDGMRRDAAARVMGMPLGSESGMFPSVVQDMASEQGEREDVMINYVQNEFVKRGIAVPSALSRRVGVFNDAAELLVLDLLRDENGDESGEGVGE